MKLDIKENQIENIQRFSDSLEKYSELQILDLNLDSNYMKELPEFMIEK